MDNNNLPPVLRRQMILQRMPKKIGNMGGIGIAGNPNVDLTFNQNNQQNNQTNQSNQTGDNKPILIGVKENARYFQYTFTGSLYLPFNDKRTYLLVQNNSGSTMYMDFTGINGSFSTGLHLAANGGYYEPFVAPINAVSISGSGSGFAIEGVRIQ